MAEKARLFGDEETRDKILSVSQPREAKNLGRKVRGFEEETWSHHRADFSLLANLAKFEQNEDLRIFLLSTAEIILVEASPDDFVWGIGLAGTDPRAHDPLQWRGQNLLGFVLMEVRTKLASYLPG